jgi:hypothetical protein
VDRAVFVGGESRHVPICQRIARELCLPSTLGDPLARLNRDEPNGAAPKINLRLPQPEWAIAVGLAIGLSPTITEQN